MHSLQQYQRRSVAIVYLEHSLGSNKATAYVVVKMRLLCGWGNRVFQIGGFTALCKYKQLPGLIHPNVKSHRVSHCIIGGKRDIRLGR